MTNACKRKNQPELVRHALMDKAIHLAASLGFAAVTVQPSAETLGQGAAGQGALETFFPAQ